MTRIFAISAAMMLATGLATGAALAQPADQPAGHTPGKCFYVNEFENWKAPDAKTIYIRVLQSDYYRLDLSAACPELLMPDSHLVTHTRGPDTVCSPVDWDLKVSIGATRDSVPCIVKAMTPLSPTDVAAIPAKYKP